MKRWKTIPALLALIALLLPCAHLDGHAHDDCPPSVFTEVHAECGSCTETVCSEKTELLPASAVTAVALPLPSRTVISRVQTDIPLIDPPLLPSAALLPIQTIQLLI